MNSQASISTPEHPPTLRLVGDSFRCVARHRASRGYSWLTLSPRLVTLVSIRHSALPLHVYPIRCIRDLSSVCMSHPSLVSTRMLAQISRKDQPFPRSVNLKLPVFECTYFRDANSRNFTSTVTVVLLVFVSYKEVL